MTDLGLLETTKIRGRTHGSVDNNPGADIVKTTWRLCPWLSRIPFAGLLNPDDHTKSNYHVMVGHPEVTCGLRHALK